METVRPETLQAQGWEKWLPGSDSLGGTNILKSLSKFGAAGVLMHKTLQPSLDMVAVWILFF
jgi:hypothetical protein